MKVLIIGAAGMIGRKLTARLARDGRLEVARARLPFHVLDRAGKQVLTHVEIRKRQPAMRKRIDHKSFKRGAGLYEATHKSIDKGPILNGFGSFADQDLARLPGIDFFLAQLGFAIVDFFLEFVGALLQNLFIALETFQAVS